MAAAQAAAEVPRVTVLAARQCRLCRHWRPRSQDGVDLAPVTNWHLSYLTQLESLKVGWELESASPLVFIRAICLLGSA